MDKDQCIKIKQEYFLCLHNYIFGDENISCSNIYQKFLKCNKL